MLLLWKLVFSYYTHAFKISVEQYVIQNQFCKQRLTGGIMAPEHASGEDF